MSDEVLKQLALQYHRAPTPGKIEVVPTKPLATQRDLALAYAPGVTAACEAIARDPAEVANLTARGNLVAVVTNGSSVLSLGPLGPLAAKPVMEGKGVLFKKFAGIDVFDIELDENDPSMLVEVIARMEPTFGGILLEDIKAPECFEVEQRLRERMKIPVFDDDQHGTAIVVAAALLNGLRVVGKHISEIRLVCAGVGASAVACLDLLVRLGLPAARISVIDSEGVLHSGRAERLDPYKAKWVRDTAERTLAGLLKDADVFLGLSAPEVLHPSDLRGMAPNPLILALASPEPEIRPEHAHLVRSDAIVCTSLPDHPNHVNNVLCFPYMFRGALDCGASTINEAMTIACVHALADLAMEDPDEIAMAAYGEHTLSFGPNYLIPKPFDPRLILELPVAVARAAMESGIATRPIEDFDAYREELSRHVYRSGLIMKPVFERAKADPKRVVYCDGEDDRVLRAVQMVVDEGLGRPILIGRSERIRERIEQLGLHLYIGEDFELIDQRDHIYFDPCWKEYHRLLERQGITEANAQHRMRTRPAVLGALLVKLGHADTMITGLQARYRRQLEYLVDVFGLPEGVAAPAAISLLLGPRGPLFLCDTHVTPKPSASAIASMALMAADQVRRFGLVPKLALLSHSNFGSDDTRSSRRMAKALTLLREQAPELEVEGEMQGDTALSEVLRRRLFPHSRLSGTANLLIMPSLDAGNIAYNLLRMVTDSVAIGPMLMGLALPGHVLTPAATVRRVVNMTAVAVVDAQINPGR